MTFTQQTQPDRLQLHRRHIQVFALQTSLAERKESYAITTESERFSEQVSSFGGELSCGGFALRRHIELTFLPCSGAFGEVRMCVHRESGAQRAVKVLRKSHMDDDEKRMLFNEINILKEIVSAAFAAKRINYSLIN